MNVIDAELYLIAIYVTIVKKKRFSMIGRNGLIKCPMCGKPAVEWASQYRLYVCTVCFNHFCRKEEDEIIQKKRK